MTRTLLIHHPCFQDHLTGHGHPERPDRLKAVEHALDQEVFDPVERVLAPETDLELARHVHASAHLDRLLAAAPDTDMIYLDPDTAMSPKSLQAARHGLGGVQHAVDQVVGKANKNAFCAMRPPGHHAETDKAMGFCLFNTIAVGARYAQQKHNLERIAILDFDVHHGNGTQEIFWEDDSILYASTHQMPLFPGTGARSETGCGNIVNSPLSAGDGPEEFRQAIQDAIIPRISAFHPDMILLSAGFDAHERDPLGSLRLTAEDFAWVTQQMMDLADSQCEGRIVSVLEGGYDLTGLADSVAAHVRQLMQA